MAPVYQFVERTYVMLMCRVWGRELSNSFQALNGLGFRKHVGIKAEGLFSDSKQVTGNRK
jgi:hypothetical protein